MEGFFRLLERVAGIGVEKNGSCFEESFTAIRTFWLTKDALFWVRRSGNLMTSTRALKDISEEAVEQVRCPVEYRRKLMRWKLPCDLIITLIEKGILIFWARRVLSTPTQCKYTVGL